MGQRHSIVVEYSGVAHHLRRELPGSHPVRNHEGKTPMRRSTVTCLKDIDEEDVDPPFALVAEQCRKSRKIDIQGRQPMDPDHEYGLSGIGRKTRGRSGR